MKILACFVSLTLLTTESSSALACPEQCRCDKEIASCSLKKLTSVPSCDDCTSILYLDLSDNLITELTDNAFTDYPNLKQINIERNQIHTIDTRAFEGLRQLVKNTIDRNNFTDIDPDTFMDNTLFTSLSLRDNPLVVSSPFLASDTLTVLDLSGCGLKILPRDTFEHLRQLEVIMLTNNELEELPANIFEPLDKLKMVHLHGNPWVCGGYLQQLTKSGIIADSKKMRCTERKAGEQQPARVPEPRQTSTEESAKRNVPEQSTVVPIKVPVQSNKSSAVRLNVCVCLVVSVAWVMNYIA